jgi:hypothetical protein
MLSLLAAMVALCAVGAAPASAATGYFWVGNDAGGCLDHSTQFNFRVFSGCNGDPRYQSIYFERTPNGPDVYRIMGKDSLGIASVCLTARGNGQAARGSRCAGGNEQEWVVRYANNRPYFDSLRYPGLCLTKSRFPDASSGFVLTTEPCAGLDSQYWRWL